MQVRVTQTEEYVFAIDQLPEDLAKLVAEKPDADETRDEIEEWFCNLDFSRSPVRYGYQVPDRECYVETQAD